MRACKGQANRVTSVTWMYGLVLAVLLVAVPPGRAEQTAGELFQAGLYAEQVHGELDKAIELYQRILDEFPTDRPVAAKALLHIGLCKEKLGRQEALEAYQKLVEQYPEQQREVTAARERIAEISKELTETGRQTTFREIRIPTGVSWDMHLSPDGQRVSLVSDGKLWIMPLRGGLGRDVPGAPTELDTAGIRVDRFGHAWSADGRWIAFNGYIPEKELAEGRKGYEGIYLVASQGGPPRKIHETWRDQPTRNYSISLSPQGKTLAFSSVDIEKKQQHIYTISVDGGEPRRLVDFPAREPAFSPDGNLIAFVEDSDIGRGGGGLWVVPAQGGTAKHVADAEYASSPIWSPRGDMIAFLDRGGKKDQIQLIAVDGDGRPAGDVIALDAPEGAAGVWLLAGWGRGNEIGAIFETPAEQGLYTLPAEGGKAMQVARTGGTPRWSPDGKRIFCIHLPRRGGGAWRGLAVGSIPAGGGRFRAIPLQLDAVMGIPSFGAGNRVSPDGRLLVFSGKTEDKPPIFLHNHIWTVPVEGGTPRRLTEATEGTTHMFPCWSPDGKTVAFIQASMPDVVSTVSDVKADICTVQVDSRKLTELTTESDGVNFGPIAWSPDGKYIAYYSQVDETSGTGILRLVSANGEGKSQTIGNVNQPHPGKEFAWSPDSKRIAFNGPDGKTISIMSVKDGSVVRVGTGLVNSDKGSQLDWSPDGERFVFVGGEGESAEFWMVENFLPKNEAKNTVVRQVWSGKEADACGAPSPNERYISYTDWETGDLAVYEIATGKKRRLTNDGFLGANKPNQMALNSKWSPDSGQIVYDWYVVSVKDRIENRFDLRIAQLDGTTPRILYSNEDVTWAQTYDWSPDGRHILACVSHKDGTIQNVLVSAADGSTHVLESSGSYYPNNMCFSPDGRYIAYDRPQANGLRNYDLSVTSTDGGHGTPLVAHPADDRLLGWAPHGKTILFISNRTGDLSLWSIPVLNGEPQGTPSLIRSGMGDVPLGLTDKGSFYYYTSGQQRNVYVVEIDPATGRTLAPPTIAVNQFEGFNMLPGYSPDGQHVAYISMRTPSSPRQPFGGGRIPGRAVLCIRSLGDGNVREVPTEISPNGAPRWAPDARSILVFGYSNDNHRGIYRVDVQTGQVTPVVVGEAIHGQYEWSRDGDAVFFVRDHRQASLCQVLVRDLKSGEEKELYKEPSRVRFSISISPDGRWLAFLNNRGTKRVLRVIPTAGGEPRDLYTWDSGGGNPYIWHTWSADGEYILVPIWPRTEDDSSTSNAGDNKWVLWRIPVEGGEPQQLGVEMYPSSLSAHPDGKHIAFSAVSYIEEARGVWALENFLPTTVTGNSR